MSSLQEEIEQTHEALKVILEDTSTFNYVVAEVFAAVDKDRDGSLSRENLKQFVSKVCIDMGMRTAPDDKAIEEVFRDLDEDNSNEVNQEEFGRFLRRLFIQQKEDCAKAMAAKK
jgi:Ca2+-binding EF-hand superfamily protein